MGAAKIRLFIAVTLLVAWVGYIAYQALAFGRFPVVSHAQLLVSTLDIVADVRADDDSQPLPQVRVQEVHWPAESQGLQGQEITVSNLPDASGFYGPGRYILPLVAGEGGQYRVAALPRSPGFGAAGVVLIYPDTPLTREQLNAIPKPQPPRP